MSQLAQSLAIIPLPAVIEPREGSFVFGPQTRIAVSLDSRELGERLRSELRPAMGFSLELTGRGGKDTISLGLDRSLKLGPEGYQIEAAADQIDIRAVEPAGLFYGIQTLKQMLPAAVFRQGRQEGVEWSVPSASIKDSPRFGWRGAHLDVSRYFMPKEFLLKFIDLLALHKLNTFHLHLTDDQGWRMEIKKYPKLTEVGAWRSDSMLTYDPPTHDGKPHGGFYTQEDLREIVAYAKERFITVVPEIEMPGHAQAAIAAYPELGNSGLPLPVGVTWGVNENVYSVDEATIQFNKDVLAEVMEVFPSKFIHIGGDEVPKTQWKASKAAQARIKELGLRDEDELQSWFVRQMDTFLAEQGRRLVGWDEILEGGLAPGATVMSWRGEEGGIAAAKAGHDVVMAPNQWTYFDHYQSRDHASEPHAIGGFLPLQKVYEYDPIPPDLTPDEAEHVLGAQGQVWTEYIATPKAVEYMAFPRLSALAEVVWSPVDKKCFDGFVTRLQKHLERLEAKDVKYRPLSPQPHPLNDLEPELASNLV
ncbi:beta-N-acetylhexosaminidase [Fimbriimonas ginsengisoli]|uniref:beta-N-acetylhexosaminidase n=1 Tax=Fimbriimonas ginsengisoli Gsoil 348 TaxID=661478 RepID=A0A068NSU4_FIMGI|nr:beta-N-acetylhexosaminidase [Fimbriimonas ginsengisoli]AIE84689.1 beta-N-acetylhexosaminidase [Fimbriimonas ginsengisoli Gsoil 348]